MACTLLPRRLTAYSWPKLLFRSCIWVSDENWAICEAKSLLDSGSSGSWFSSCVVNSVKKLFSVRVELAPLTPLPLQEHREKDDPPTRSDEIRDAPPVDAELTKLPAKLPGMRLAEMDAPFREQVDVKPRLAEGLVVQTKQPCLDLRFELHLAP